MIEYPSHYRSLRRTFWWVKRRKGVPDNYPSASEMTRNLAQLMIPYEVLETVGKFRIVRLEPPFWGGYELWVVNEKGFFWEPALDLDRAFAYLNSDEAKEYNA